MHTISNAQIAMVSGGTTAANAAADREIGTAIGKVFHGLSSKEARIGGLLGPVGAVYGAIIHFRRHH